MEPQNARSRRTRQALLQAARELAEAKGLATLTVGSVAERAGVTRRAVYLHFETRTQMLTSLFDYVNEQEDLASSVQPVLDAPDAPAAVAEWAAHVGRYHPRIARVARAVQRARDTDADAARHWQLVQEDWHRLCLGIAGRASDEGRLKSGWTTDTMADMLHALMSLDVLETLVDVRGWTTDAYASHLRDAAQGAFLAG